MARQYLPVDNIVSEINEPIKKKAKLENENDPFAEFRNSTPLQNPAIKHQTTKNQLNPDSLIKNEYSLYLQADKSSSSH